MIKQKEREAKIMENTKMNAEATEVTETTEAIEATEATKTTMTARYLELEANYYKGSGKCWCAKVDPKTKKILEFLTPENVEKKEGFNYKLTKTFKIFEDGCYKARTENTKSFDLDFYFTVENGELTKGTDYFEAYEI